MRFIYIITLVIFGLGLWQNTAFAVEENSQRSNNFSRSVESSPAKKDSRAEENKNKTDDEKEEKAQEENTPLAINWVEVESTGILSTAKQGALDRTLWNDQKRSEILLNLGTIPSSQPLQKALSLQRRLLLSGVDTAVIENDIPPSAQTDILVKRIDVLMDMGLYEDAWELYTQKAENPYNAAIAQRGLLLMLMRGDAATACLEEKVMAARFENDSFFKTLDQACAFIIGTPTPANAFAGQEFLKSVFESPDFSIGAHETKRLLDLTPLERALAFANKKISYGAAFTPAVIGQTPSSLLALFYADQSLPDTLRAAVGARLVAEGLSPYIRALARSDLVRKAYDIKGAEERWPVLEQILRDPNRRVGDLSAFSDLLEQADPKNVPSELIPRILGAFLIAGRELSPDWIARAKEEAGKNPKFYIYLQAFQSLTPTKNLEISKVSLKNALGGLTTPERQQLLAIIDTLDSSQPLSPLLDEVYEKELPLTLSGNYVMPSQSLLFTLQTASTQKQVGITVMAVLNVLAAPPERLYAGSVSKVLSSMLNVGLIEDANAIGAELLVGILNKL